MSCQGCFLDTTVNLHRTMGGTGGETQMWCIQVTVKTRRKQSCLHPDVVYGILAKSGKNEESAEASEWFKAGF